MAFEKCITNLAVKEAIIESFADTIYPGDNAIFKSFIYDSPDMLKSTVVKFFLGKKWQDIELNELYRAHPYQLSVVGAAYYLPAILLATVDTGMHGEEGDFLVDFIYDDIWNITPELNQQRQDFKNCLNQKQAFAVVKYLEFRSGKDDEAAPSLNGSWLSAKKEFERIRSGAV